MTRKSWIFFLLILLLLTAGGVIAQVYSGRSSSMDPGFGRSSVRTSGRSSQIYTNQGSMVRGGRGGGRALPNQQFLNSSQDLFTWSIDPEFNYGNET